MEKTDSSTKITEPNLFSNNQEVYGEDYNNHLLTQYRLCVEMADNISSRRCMANNFFLSINSLLITAMGIVSNLGAQFLNFNQPWLILTSIAGMLFCWTWLATIRCYRKLNDAKFTVINELEKKLPVSPFDVEWALLNCENGKSKYKELTKVERWVPRIFIVLYAILCIAGISPLVQQLINFFA